MSLLERSQHTTYCPYKGEASYYRIPALGEPGLNSVWTYETPFETVSEIAGYLAFYRTDYRLSLLTRPQPTAHNSRPILRMNRWYSYVVNIIRKRNVRNLSRPPFMASNWKE